MTTAKSQEVQDILSKDSLNASELKGLMGLLNISNRGLSELLYVSLRGVQNMSQKQGIGKPYIILLAYQIGVKTKPALTL